MRRQLKLPVYLLCDANPGGLHIALIYKHGSQVYADDNHRMCVPDANWLGLHPQDVAAYVTRRLPCQQCHFEHLP